MQIAHSKPSLTLKDWEALKEVFKNGMIAEGEIVREFEEAVAKYLEMQGGVATSTGTLALFLALKALDVSSGDEVIIPTYVCRSVLDAVNYTGATPVLCDVGEDWCMNVETVKPFVTNRTKAIIVVHIFGISADVEALSKLGIPIIEDCAQSFGGTLKGKKLGTFGEMCVCSFHATKLFTSGEGGMVLTSNSKLLNKLRELKYGRNSLYKIRYFFPMTNIQAILGLRQLNRINEFIAKRRKISEIYFSSFNDLPMQLPWNVRTRSIFFRFPIRVKGNFEEIKNNFHKFGIHIRRGVDKLLHDILGWDARYFPSAVKLFNQTISIPIYPALKDYEIEHIVTVTRQIFSNF